MFKNTGSQKLTVLAFADAGHASLDPGEKVTGDAANITCKVEQDDDGTRSATDDTNPTETEGGQYVFDLLQAEVNGNKLAFYPESSTAGVQVVALPSNVIYTRPPNFSALGIESDGDLTKVNTLDGHTAQTGDSFARLGEPDGASIADDISGLALESTLTAAMGGTFNASTDSLEAIRNRGDAEWATADVSGVAEKTDLPTNFGSLGIEVDGDLTKVNTLDGHTAQTGDTFAQLPTNFSSLGIESDGDLKKVNTLNGHTAQTGDNFARLGAPAGASLAADVAANQTDLNTLLSRIPSALFSGITSFAEWLGALAGKQTGDATARTEIRATGAGSGTFDETTDSQEAIRDRGDAEWTTGGGGGGGDTKNISVEITDITTSC